MTKNQLVASVAEKAGLTRDEAARAVNALFATFAEGLAAGDRVPLQGIGTLDVVETPPRTVRHPRTGVSIRVAPGRRVRFRVASALRALVRLSR